jgi:hypothetical protein
MEILAENIITTQNNEEIILQGTKEISTFCLLTTQTSK